ncbi:nitrogenase component 1 [Lysinibacillus sp. NPDC097231]|uniref:nitrogenase component 1 n=1 Tax=Lysinibacillus sp. NPDC097231 TaxID=3364142 RepID=UPI0037FEF5F1
MSLVAPNQVFKTRKATQYPGAHCGLFEVSMQAPFFPSSVALVLSPPSCSYHARVASGRRQLSFNSNGNNIYSLNLTQEDMVFGVDLAVEEAIEELAKSLNPEIIFLVSTCTPEIIGFDATVLNLVKERIHSKVLVVKTNGYACLHHQKGKSEFLLSVVELMKPLEKKKKHVNIIGLRSLRWRECELVQLLEKVGVTINAVLPGAESLAQIESASQAELNILIGRGTLQLAEAMSEKFDIPYVEYEQTYNTQKILENYERIAAALEVNLSEDLKQLLDKHNEKVETARNKLKGISFGIGTVEGNNIEAVNFYTKVGMKPLFLQTREKVEDNNPYMKELKQMGIEFPIVNQFYGPDLKSLVQRFKPQIFIGHALGEMLEAENVAHSHPMTSENGPGFIAFNQELDNIINLVECHVKGEF